MSRSKIILLVEDEATIRLSYAKTLEDEGYEIIAAPSGEEAINAVKKIPGINLILMDIALGTGMDGAEAAQEILKDADIPILFLLDHTERDVIAKTGRVASYGYVPKDSGMTVPTASVKMAFKLHDAHIELSRKDLELEKSEERYRSVFNNMLDGYAIHEIILDDLGNPVDYRFLAINPAFERLTGLSAQAVVGRTVREVLPDIEPIWIERYGAVALTGRPAHFNQHNGSLNRHYEVSAFSPGPRQFACTIVDITERRQAERAIRENQAIMRTVVESTPDMIFMKDREGRYLLMNSSAARSVGKPVEEVIGKLDSDIFPLEIARSMRKVDKQVMASGKPRVYEQAVPINGELRTMLTTKSVCRDADGGIIGLMGIGRDITERKQREEELRESEERYRVAIENSTDGVTIVGNNRHLYVNQRFLDMFGYGSLEEVMDKPAYAIVHPDDRERVTGYVRRGQRGEPTPQHYGFKGIRKDGTVIHIEASVSVITYRGERAGLGYFRDVTHRKEVEELLFAAEQKYRIVADNTYDWEFWLSPEKRFVYVSPSCERVSGYSPAQFETDPQLLERIVHPEDRERFRAHVNESRTDRPLKQLTFRITRRDGEVRWIEHTCLSIKGEKGEYLGNRGSNKDVTDRKRLEEQLVQAHKMEAVGTLAGGIAHDFNNILTVVIGLGTLIRETAQNDPVLKAHIDQILTSSERAAGLTQSLLAFSRKQRIVLEPHHVNDTVRSGVKLLGRLLPEDIELRLDLTDEDVIARMDVTQMHQVLMNLATNARDAMQRGGALTIKTETVALDERFRKTHGFGKPGRYVCLTVSDTGVGMDEETMKHIFDPFFTTKEVGKGTGLGLASVYGTVKQHEGYVAVSSTPLKGTTFRIYLPLGKATRPQTAPPVEQPAKGTETILIVEDDSDVRNMLTTVLRGHGYVTMEAADGDDAVRTYQENRESIGLVILDVVMPRKNGKDVLDEVMKFDPGVRAIFISGYTGDAVINKGIRSETVDFLPKPLSVMNLLTKVREVLDR